MQEVSVALGQNGRVVIPANIRKQMNLQQGQRLRLMLDGDQLILKKTTDIISKLQNRFSSVPESLANELIAERRQEAKQEEN